MEEKAEKKKQKQQDREKLLTISSKLWRSDLKWFPEHKFYKTEHNKQ